MTGIVIQPFTAANRAGLNCCDNSFTVEAELNRDTGGRWAEVSYQVEDDAKWPLNP
jgi:hypothetical protein